MSDKDAILTGRFLKWDYKTESPAKYQIWIHEAMDEWAEEKYNKGIADCIKVVNAEYRKMKLSKADTYCATRIKHLIDSLEKLKSTK